MKLEDFAWPHVEGTNKQSKTHDSVKHTGLFTLSKNKNEKE